jgi:hypothetical protein
MGTVGKANLFRKASLIVACAALGLAIFWLTDLHKLMSTIAAVAATILLGVVLLVILALVAKRTIRQPVKITYLKIGATFNLDPSQAWTDMYGNQLSNNQPFMITGPAHNLSLGDDFSSLVVMVETVASHPGDATEEHLLPAYTWVIELS